MMSLLGMDVCRHDEHKWIGQYVGGDPTDAISSEWICLCEVCGIENPGSSVNLAFVAECDRVRRMSRFRRWFLARFHLSDAAVCVMSEGGGMLEDYHSYLDFHSADFPRHTCSRCRKGLAI